MNATTRSTHREESLGERDSQRFEPVTARSCSVKLNRLPTGLEFPLRFRERISFDASRGRLQFRGLMFKADYDQLRALSSDAAYLHALEELFRNSAYRSVAIDIGIEQVMDDGSSARSHGPRLQNFKNWAARWIVLGALGLSGAAFLGWYLYHLH